MLGRQKLDGMEVVMNEEVMSFYAECGEKG